MSEHSHRGLQHEIDELTQKIEALQNELNTKLS
jgi:hypothetical protein